MGLLATSFGTDVGRGADYLPDTYFSVSLFQTFGAVRAFGSMGTAVFCLAQRKYHRRSQCEPLDIPFWCDFFPAIGFCHDYLADVCSLLLGRNIWSEGEFCR